MADVFDLPCDGVESYGEEMASVLVVDDHEDVRLALTTLLEFAGHGVSEATDGADALDMAMSDPPELILLDIGMKKVDGFETLMFLKADQQTRDIPVIMLTSRGQPEDRLRARKLGAIDYINKPWEPGEVETRVRRALGAARSADSTGADGRLLEWREF